jgi:hypothetical protein
LYAFSSGGSRSSISGGATGTLDEDDDDDDDDDDDTGDVDGADGIGRLGTGLGGGGVITILPTLGRGGEPAGRMDMVGARPRLTYSIIIQYHNINISMK